MRTMVKFLAVLVLAVALSHSAMAAPLQGSYMATQHAAKLDMFDHFLGLLGAIWGGGAPGGNHGAIWGGGAPGGNHGAIWGGGAPGGNHGAIWGGQSSGGNQGAIWGGQGTGGGH